MINNRWLNGYTYIRYQPSAIACAAWYVSRKIYGLEGWSNFLQWLTGCTVADLERYITELDADAEDESEANNCAKAAPK